MSKHVCLALCFRNTEKGLLNTEILLVCEATQANDPKEGWQWSLPGGKCCKQKRKTVDCCQEKPEETVVREFKEETGHIAEIKQLFSSRELVNDEMKNKFMQHVYTVEIKCGQMLENKTPSGSNSPQWFKLSAVPRSLFVSHQKIIRDFFTAKPLRK